MSDSPSDDSNSKRDNTIIAAMIIVVAAVLVGLIVSPRFRIGGDPPAQPPKLTEDDGARPREGGMHATSGNCACADPVCDCAHECNCNAAVGQECACIGCAGHVYQTDWEKQKAADPRKAFLDEWNKVGSDLDKEPPISLIVGSDIRNAAAPGLPPAKLYARVPIKKLTVKDGWARPRAMIDKPVKVTMVKLEDDGDHHFVVEVDGEQLVCEVVPDLVPAKGEALKPPKVGMTIWVWGIPRWDGQHKWGEIHPVVGWREK